MKRKALLALALSLACGGVVLALSGAKVLETVELKTLDLRFRLSPNARRASPDVAIVAIDETSLLEFKRNGVVWNWPRDFYGALVQYLSRCGAKAVVFDLLFPDPDIDRKGSDGADTDAAFAAALREAGNVVLAAQMAERASLTSGNNALVRPGQVSLKGKASEEFPNAVLPIESFQKGARLLGASNFKEDSDGICRRVPPLFSYKGAVIPNLGVAGYLAARGTTSLEIDGVTKLRAAGEDIPLDSNGKFLLTWYGRGGPNGAFKHYPFARVLRSMQMADQNKEPGIPASAFRGKIVFVGASAAGLFDFKSTPFTVLEPYPGMEIHATIASNLLNKDFLVQAPRAVCWAVVFVFAAAVCSLFLLGARMAGAVAFTLAAAAAWPALALWLFRSRSVWLDVAAPECSLLLAFAASAAASYALEGRARRRLRETFGRYLSPVVVSEIIERREAVELGGQELIGTVFFSDIKGFTSISETLSPRELVAFLNGYFSSITEVILRNEAMLDKYIGDAIMAVFGAPLPLEGHEARACAAALEVQRILDRAGAGPGRGPVFQTRIGLNTGRMIVGNIGSPSRMDYTAIGDTVNLASRLEGTNKVFGTRIIISGSTHRGCGGLFEARELDLIAVKGKSDAVVIYELLGRKGEISEAQADLKRRFEEGLRRYRAREFALALSEFEGALGRHPEDAASRLFADRCRGFLKAPPGAGWDGVFHSTTK
jgi:adenylate cyclase